jgi:hypothetical protein
MEKAHNLTGVLLKCVKVKNKDVIIFTTTDKRNVSIPKRLITSVPILLGKTYLAHVYVDEWESFKGDEINLKHLVSLDEMKQGDKISGKKHLQHQSLPEFLDNETLEDTDGDIVTSVPIQKAEIEAVELSVITSIIQNANEIASLIPTSMRAEYPKNNQEAALEFYKKHPELFQ